MATCLISPTPQKVAPAENQSSCPDPQSILIERAQRGDEKAFAALFQMHKKRVHSVCLYMTKDIAEAEDLTQEAFMQVFRGIDAFRGNASFSTWLHRVAVNTVLTTLRRRKPSTLFSLDQLVSPNSARLSEFGRRDLALTGVVDRIALRRAIRELPKGCRTIFALHDIEGYEHREIAQILHCSIGTSKSQLHRARLKMRDLLFPEKKRMWQCVSVPGVQELIAALP